MGRRLLLFMTFQCHLGEYQTINKAREEWNMTKEFMRFLLIGVIGMLAPTMALAQDHVTPVTAYVEKNVKPWLSDAAVIKAIEASNQKHQALTQADIDKLDGDWIKARKEKAAHAPMDALMKNELAAFLKAKKQASGGVIAELFVMDNKGLNVAQTDPTSDFWQGDEAKWQKTFSVGPDAIFVDKVEDDDGMKVSQANLTIADPQTKKAIGAITVVIDMGKLPK